MGLPHTMKLELIGTVSIYLGIGIQIVTALVLGGLVGYDREQKMKAAGLKTNMLICIGATLYTTISMLNVHAASGMVDPNRVAAQIVSGIGFLGAGAIIQGRGNVIGLTTAATIWVVAAIGYTVGVGYPLTAAIFSITVLIVLRVIRPFYSLMERSKDKKYYQLEVLSTGSVKKFVVPLVLSETDAIDEIYEDILDRNKKKMILNIFLTIHPRTLERITYEIKESVRVEKVRYHVAEQSDEDDDDENDMIKNEGFE